MTEAANEGILRRDLVLRLISCAGRDPADRAPNGSFETLEVFFLNQFIRLAKELRRDSRGDLENIWGKSPAKGHKARFSVQQSRELLAKILETSQRVDYLGQRYRAVGVESGSIRLTEISLGLSCSRMEEPLRS